MSIVLGRKWRPGLALSLAPLSSAGDLMQTAKLADPGRQLASNGFRIQTADRAQRDIFLEEYSHGIQNSQDYASHEHTSERRGPHFRAGAKVTKSVANRSHRADIQHPPPGVARAAQLDTETMRDKIEIRH
jgi:hypothetical protein